ncbi:hypothetical protein [Amycolatopsis minnesotensis]|uniref:Uncharacterized protein n=1 Tax=Amycolatopsis minnesotensis TaxID=337894 RepID=A0ABP5DZN8_9PSEU
MHTNTVLAEIVRTEVPVAGSFDHSASVRFLEDSRPPRVRTRPTRVARYRGCSASRARWTRWRSRASCRGIGPFSAQLILVRGAGHPDVFPRDERRLADEMRHRYGVPAATVGLGEGRGSTGPNTR